MERQEGFYAPTRTKPESHIYDAVSAAAILRCWPPHLARTSDNLHPTKQGHAGDTNQPRKPSTARQYYTIMHDIRHHRCRRLPGYAYSHQQHSKYLSGSPTMLAMIIFSPENSVGLALKWAVAAASTASKTAGGVLMSTATCMWQKHGGCHLSHTRCCYIACGTNMWQQVSTVTLCVEEALLLLLMFWTDAVLCCSAGGAWLLRGSQLPSRLTGMTLSFAFGALCHST